MFTVRFISPDGRTDFSSEPLLINTQFKYRSLGEIVAMARVTNEKPLPTRNGVYIGDVSIPRDHFDRVDARNAAMDRYSDAVSELKDAEAKMVAEKKSQERAAFEAEIRQKYQKSE